MKRVLSQFGAAVAGDRRRDSNAPLAPGPVAIAQASHQQLAGRMARQLALEVDPARHLVAGEMDAAEREDLSFERGAGLEAGLEMELVLGTLYEDDANEYLIWKWRPA